MSESAERKDEAEIPPRRGLRGGEAVTKKPRVLVRKSVGRDSRCAAIRLRGSEEELLAAISPDLTLPTAVTLRTIIYARGRGRRTQDRERGDRGKEAIKSETSLQPPGSLFNTL